MMKKFKHTFYAVSIIMVITSILVGFAKSDEEKIEVFRSSKIITVIVETKILKAEFEEITKKLLSNYCGIQVLSNKQNQDNVLRIKAKGKRLEDRYMKATPIPGRKAGFQLSSLHRNAYRPFGAYVRGKIYLEVNRKTVLKQPFRSYISPPEWGPGMYNVAELEGMPSEINFNPDFWDPDTTSWKQDPFKIAFRSFIRSLLEVLGKVYGFSVLVSVLEDEDIAINDEYDFYIRTYAALALGKLKDSRAIEPLIIAMQNVRSFEKLLYTPQATVTVSNGKRGKRFYPDKDSYIRSHLLTALYNITGENFGPHYDKWRNWWDKNKEIYETN